MVNIRSKGQRGERYVVDFCNEVYAEVHSILSIPLPPKPIAQRRQNQSAVGGMDIDNTCLYAIEVKNQETLQLNTWWQQCVVSARETRKRPVLIYNHKRKWHVMIEMNPWVHQVEEFNHYIKREAIRAIISIDDFREIFRAHAIDYIKNTGNYT